MERHNEIIDLEQFIYMHFDMIEPTTFLHAIYSLRHENNSTMFNVSLYQQLSYDTCEVTKACFAGDLEMTVLLGN